jgi:hypothetical protein
MKLKGFDDREYSLSLDKKISGNCSDLHKRARKLLKTIFKFDTVFEEVQLPGSKTPKNGTLYIDFFIPTQFLAVEVQGQQHTEYTPFFHKNKAEFVRSQVRDNIKREWCELNSFTLIELPYDETDEQWRERIDNR